MQSVKTIPTWSLKRIVVIGAIYTAVSFAVGYFKPVSESFSGYLLSYVNTSLYAFGAFVAVRQRKHAAGRADRWAWTALTTCLGLTAIVLAAQSSDTLFFDHEEIFALEYFFSGCWIAIYASFAAVPLLFGLPRAGKLGHSRVLLDALSVGAALFVIAWALVLRDTYDNFASGDFENIHQLIYGVLDFVWVGFDILIVTAGIIAYRHRSGVNRTAVALFTTAIVFMAIGDTVAGVSTEAWPSWLHGVYAIADAFLILTAFSRTSTANTNAVVTHRAREVLAPYVPMVAALGLLAWRRVDGAPMDPVLEVTALVMVLFVVSRQLTALFDNYALSTRLAGTVALLEKSQADLLYLANNDPLTSLFNRRYLDQYVDQRDKSQGRIATLFLDLNDFKLANDQLGHELGDALLVEAAERLRKCVRAQDVVVRLGGDEFAVLLENISGIEVVQAMSARIANALRQEYVVGDLAVTISASVGYAIEEEDESFGDLLRRADMAMYTEKNESRPHRARFGVRPTQPSEATVDLVH
jgi:diguanylate cyclase (GGDEF)-like protein